MSGAGLWQREEHQHDIFIPVSQIPQGRKTTYLQIVSADALNAADNLKIQEVLGTLHFYGRAIDSTILAAIGRLAPKQARAPSQPAMEKLTQLLNYCFHPDAVIGYTASNMIFAIKSDASYLSVTKARSQAGGFFLLPRP